MFYRTRNAGWTTLRVRSPFRYTAVAVPLVKRSKRATWDSECGKADSDLDLSGNGHGAYELNFICNVTSYTYHDIYMIPTHYYKLSFVPQASGVTGLTSRSQTCESQNFLNKQVTILIFHVLQPYETSPNLRAGLRRKARSVPCVA